MSQASGPTSGIEAFAFVRRTVNSPSAFVLAARAIPGVRFAGRTVGTSVAVVVFVGPSLAAIQDDAIPALHAAGGRGIRWTVANLGTEIGFGIGPKRGKTATGALVRIHAPDRGVALAQLQETFQGMDGPADGYVATAVGSFGSTCTVLLDLGAPSEDELFEQLARLDGLAAIAGYDVDLAHWTDNATWTAPAT